MSTHHPTCSGNGEKVLLYLHTITKREVKNNKYVDAIIQMSGVCFSEILCLVLVSTFFFYHFKVVVRKFLYETIFHDSPG